MEGWVKVHRQLILKPIWTGSTLEQKVILITLLLMASHKENEWEFKGQKYKVKPGQFITSLPSIAKESGDGISIQNVRTALKRFEKLDFLTDESTNRNRLITIVNWEIYQRNDVEANNQSNRRLTGNQQAPNSYQECKNEKNNLSTSTTTPTQENEGSELTVMDVHTEVFGTLHMTGIMSALVQNLLKQGCSENTICEMMLEAGESSAKPNIRFLESIAKRWIEEGITSREESKRRKEEKYAKPITNGQDVGYGGHSKKSTSPSISDEEMQRLVERSHRKLQVVRGNRDGQQDAMGDDGDISYPWESNAVRSGNS